MDNYQLLKKRIETNEVILVTGAGFSMPLFDKSGSNLPSGNTLKSYIWPLAFDGNPDNSDIKLVYKEALKMKKNKLQELFDECFRVDRNKIDDRYRQWYSLPWKKIYTFNIDDGPEETFAKYPELLEKYKIINPLDNSRINISSEKRAPLIKLHGSIESFPDITFSDSDYAKVSASKENKYYKEFAYDMLYSHVLMVGCSLNEPVLDHFIADVLLDNDGSPQNIARSWAVNPSYDKGTKAKLEGLNFSIAECKEKYFFESYLENLSFEINENPKETSEKSIQNVSELIAAAKNGSTDFLKGNYPQWGDIRDGYAAELSSFQEIISATKLPEKKPILIRGYAGSGKTTILMQAGQKLKNEGYSIGWIPNNYDRSLSSLREEILSSEYDYILVDDYDRFSTDGIGLFDYSFSTKIITAIRSARSSQLYNNDDLSKFHLIELNQLEEQDAILLVEKLDQYRRLGNYINKIRKQEGRKITTAEAKDKLIQKIRGNRKRELLSSMIEVSSATTFSEFIEHECQDLSIKPYQFEIYQLLAFSSFTGNHGLSQKDIISCLSETPKNYNKYKKALGELEESKMILKQSNDNSHYSFRHRVIAEKTMDFLRKNIDLSDLVEKIIYWSYSHSDYGRNFKDTAGKLFVRSINHQTLQQTLKEYPKIIKVYISTESFLSNEFHYWLQRGNIEATYNDFDEALNSFGYADMLKPDDYILKISMLHAEFGALEADLSDESSRDRAIEIVYELGESLEDDKILKKSPNSITLMLEKGLILLRNNYVETQEKIKLASVLSRQGTRGKKFHSENDYISKAWNSFESYKYQNPTLFKINMH